MMIQQDAPIAALDLETLCQRLGGRMTGSDRFNAPCPAHDDRMPSLSVTLASNGKPLWFCHAGCEYRDIIEAAGLQGQRLVPQLHIPKNADAQERRRLKVAHIWDSAHNPDSQGPHEAYCAGVMWNPYARARRYLTARGILLPPGSRAIRIQPNHPYWKDNELIGSYPAIIARIDAPSGELVAVHQTYLTPDGRSKADVPVVKKVRTIRDGATVGGAIKLFIPTDYVLGLAEGIETALACHMETRLPVWACVSATLLEQVIVPCFVKEVVIFADNDKSRTGLISAKRLAKRLLAEGRTVKVLVPPTEGMDWCDVITGKGN